MQSSHTPSHMPVTHTVSDHETHSMLVGYPSKLQLFVSWHHPIVNETSGTLSHCSMMVTSYSNCHPPHSPRNWKYPMRFRNGKILWVMYSKKRTPQQLRVRLSLNLHIRFHSLKQGMSCATAYLLLCSMHRSVHTLYAGFHHVSIAASTTSKYHVPTHVTKYGTKGCAPMLIFYTSWSNIGPVSASGL
jgi:hypothetical protein